MSGGWPAQVGKYGPGQPADFSGERVTRSVAESMERLGVEYIDVILVHDVEYIDDLQKAGTPGQCTACMQLRPGEDPAEAASVTAAAEVPHLCRTCFRQ